MRIPEVTVLVDFQTLVAGLHPTGVCETEDGVPLPVSTVQRLCCDAEIIPAALDTRGDLLELGRSARTVNRAQRRALRAMHRTCAHHDGTVPYSACRIHHVRFWVRDRGPTDIDEHKSRRYCHRTRPRPIDVRERAVNPSQLSLEGILSTGMGRAKHVRITDSATALRRLTKSVLIEGDATRGLDLLPARSVRTVVTSPPYWSLRDYSIDDQIGRNDALGDYIKHVVAAFDQVRRVLTDDGTAWLNVGDSYTSGNRTYRAPDRKNRARAMSVRPPTPDGLKPKDLIGVPWRLAFALQDSGWWVRSEIIWNKPNAHPESVRDRPTKSHETVFLLSKSQDYFYDVDAVSGPNGRRLRTVWDISTEPRRRETDDDDHPAPMPTTLARQCIAITSEPGDFVLDPYAGSGTTLLAARDLGRRFVGVELNPTFVDLIERRL